MTSSRSTPRACRLLPAIALFAQFAGAADVPTGRIVDEVRCAAGASQSYALYLPSGYRADRTWPVIFAFDPGARGRVPVERYQAAAERYGYIVAGSNNSRNGPWEVSTGAARAMTYDVASRFRIDERRVYTAGMSGGARVALGLALGSGNIAGVIASSAGFPDSKPRKRVAFPIFGTAGLEDFNLLEMREMDRALASPHRLAVFAGGHSWLPGELAVEAVEWMEIQAVKSGSAVAGEQIGRIFAKRVAAIEGLTLEKDRYRALLDIAADFEGLKEVSPFAARAEQLGRDKQVRAALKRERDEEAAEQRQTREILELEAQLAIDGRRSEALNVLRSTWKKLSTTANGSADSAGRQMARRILRGLSMSARERVRDDEYLKMVGAYRGTR